MKKASLFNRIKIAFKIMWLIISNKKGTFNIPDNEKESLARCFLPDILAFFESEEGKAEYAAWKDEQEKNKEKEAS